MTNNPVYDNGEYMPEGELDKRRCPFRGGAEVQVGCSWEGETWADVLAHCRAKHPDNVPFTYYTNTEGTIIVKSMSTMDEIQIAEEGEDELQQYLDNPLFWREPANLPQDGGYAA